MPQRCTVVTETSHNTLVLPFTRETPARQWLGFVHEEAEAPPSMLSSRVMPVLVLLGIAALVVSGGKTSHPPEAPPPSSAAAARMRVASVAPASDEPAAAKEQAVAPKPEPTREPAAAPQPVPAAEPAPPEQAEPAPEPAPKPKAKPRPAPKPLSPAAARRAQRASARLRGAVREARVQASPENFAVVPVAGETGWEDAAAACRDANVDGVGGWKLPSRAEAREVHRGKASPRTAYWTRQRGRHDDTIYVYDPRTRRSSPWLDQEIASVVCVQPRPR